jgi:hypothetical protein
MRTLQNLEVSISIVTMVRHIRRLQYFISENGQGENRGRKNKIVITLLNSCQHDITTGALSADNTFLALHSTSYEIIVKICR